MLYNYIYPLLFSRCVLKTGKNAIERKDTIVADEKKSKKNIYYDGLTGNEPPKYKGESSSISDIVDDTKNKIDDFVQSDSVQEAKEKATQAAKEAKEKTEEKVKELKEKANEMDPAKRKKLIIGAIIAIVLLIAGIIWYRHYYYWYYWGGDDAYYEDYGDYEDDSYYEEDYSDDDYEF